MKLKIMKRSTKIGEMVMFKKILVVCVFCLSIFKINVANASKICVYVISNNKECFTVTLVKESDNFYNRKFIWERLFNAKNLEQFISLNNFKIDKNKNKNLYTKIILMTNQISHLKHEVESIDYEFASRFYTELDSQEKNLIILLEQLANK
jgi:hypothetical protein